MSFFDVRESFQNVKTPKTSTSASTEIHSGTVSLDKDKYLTPAPYLRRTRASHELQYTRQFAYSDALKNSFSPELFRFGIVSLLQWSHLRPLWNLRLLFNHRPRVLACLYLYLVNSFNGPPQMFFSPLTKF